MIRVGSGKTGDKVAVREDEFTKLAKSKGVQFSLSDMKNAIKSIKVRTKEILWTQRQSIGSRISSNVVVVSASS